MGWSVYPWLIGRARLDDELLASSKPPSTNSIKLVCIRIVAFSLWVACGSIVDMDVEEGVAPTADNYAQAYMMQKREDVVEELHHYTGNGSKSL